jgi:hypothetical protein
MVVSEDGLTLPEPYVRIERATGEEQRITVEVDPFTFMALTAAVGVAFGDAISTPPGMEAQAAALWEAFAPEGFEPA